MYELDLLGIKRHYPIIKDDDNISVITRRI